MESHQIYRHKKFDVGRSLDQVEFLLKEELISRSGTPCSSQLFDEEAEDLSISLCSSDQETQFLPMPKRRRLASSSESSSVSVSSYHTLGPINTETIQDIFKYHANMVRKFPKKERSPKDQERRNKNTVACRMSRRKKKFDDLQIEQQYKEFANEHLKIAEQSLRAKVYLNHLKQLVQQENQSAPKPPKEENVKRNFTIDYLIGGIRREQV
ncbi:hypothetical protein KR009_002043 [Drosophila setifemur]|nr:hypothetical protein KR009_002043 [Drosophila setifemur]